MRRIELTSALESMGYSQDEINTAVYHCERNPEYEYTVSDAEDALWMQTAS